MENQFLQNPFPLRGLSYGNNFMAGLSSDAYMKKGLESLESCDPRYQFFGKRERPIDEMMEYVSSPEKKSKIVSTSSQYLSPFCPQSMVPFTYNQNVIQSGSTFLNQRPYLSMPQIPIPNELTKMYENPNTIKNEKVKDAPEKERKIIKMEKNRVSAKKCRARKKVYIESLEAKVKELNHELEECRKEIQELKENQKSTLSIEYSKKNEELVKKVKEDLMINKTEIEIEKDIKKLFVF